MKNYELNELIKQTQKKLEQADKILSDQFIEIMKMPSDERKKYLPDYYTIENAIDFMAGTIQSLYSEAQYRGELGQIENLTQQIKNAKFYIKQLGGDPSILSYIKSIDVV
jgi:translation initiation factor 2B subunit (eIF-2B alpha/beta/delta family)